MENAADSQKEFSIPTDIVKDAVYEVTIPEDNKTASIKITPPANGGKGSTFAGMAQALADRGVVFGVRADLLRKLAENPRYNKLERVAEAVLPTPGSDSRFVYHFPSTKDKAPQILSDGSVDYKQLGILYNVRENDVLCTKMPATEGEPGKGVTGEEIPASFGKDLPLPLGKNTRPSEDGLHVLSAIDGYVDIIGNLVQVMDVYQVKGDVDYKTGNINFVGNVHVLGNVLQGFEVRAEGNVNIDGCVEGGRIIAGGNIVIKQGIIGMNTGKVDCGSDLRCKYIQNATANVENYFETESCVNSTINCGGNVRMLGSKAVIIASHINARHTIECVNIGSKTVSVPSVLEVGSDPHLINKSASIPKEMTEIQKNLIRIDSLVDLFQKLHVLGRLTEDKYRTLVNLKNAKESSQARLADLFLEKEDVKQRMLSAGYGVVNATGMVYAGTVIVMGEERKKLDADYKYTRFYRTQEGITTGPAEKA